MAITNLSVARIINIKERLRAALLRRKYYGDLSSLASSSYDFNNIPQLNGLILSEHGQKTINLLLNATNLGNLKKIENDNYIMRDITAIETWLNNYENRDYTTSDSGCRGNCAGLCTSHCSTVCAGSCMTGCSTGCQSGCNGSCVGNCNTMCVGNCSTSCWSDCASNCTGGSKI